MSKSESEVVRGAAQQVLELFSNAKADVPLIYHGFKRSRTLVDDCKEIAKGNEIDGAEGEILLLAAWFHDAGYAAGKDGGLGQSVELARAFLARQDQPKSLADGVAACLASAQGVESRNGLASDVLHDALLAPLAGKSYLEEAELLRLEEEERTGKSWSDLDWTRSRIELLHQHEYRTRWARLEYEGGRAKNLARLHKRLRKQLEEATEQKAEEAKVSKDQGKMAEGLFGDLTRNQLRALSIADRRTNTMIHVNAIMISLLVGLVLRKLEEHRNLIIPTIVLLCSNLAVVILSILSMRAGRERLRLPEEIAAHDRNPFVTFTDLKISLPDYLARMKGLLSDASRLQDAMFECLYFGRNLIVQRRKMLQLTYDVFIYGLAISLVLFIAAILFGADTHPKV